MKSWQSILINGCVTILAVFVAIGLFTPDTPPDRANEISEALTAQIKGIQLKLNSVEEAVLNANKQILMTPPPAESGKTTAAFPKLDQKLDMILGKLTVIENQRSRTQAPQNFGRSFGPPPILQRQSRPPLSATGENPTSWINRLSEDKKREVEIIFEENSAQLRENLPPPNPDGSLPDHQTILEIMKESDLQLKQELKTILTEEEYQQFLDSLPEPVPEMPNLPGVQENQ